MDLNDFDIVFYGHTHVSKVEKIKNIKFINPGSVTLPKENTKRSFIVLHNDMCVFVDINGNIIEKHIL
jgi:putative phosphoesterase